MDNRMLIRRLGIPATYKGHFYLAYAIDLVLEDEDCLLMVTKSLYPKIARQFQTQARNVERDLRTVVKLCWERGDRQLFCSLTGYSLPFKPNTGEFLDYLAAYLKREQEKERAQGAIGS